MLALLLLAVLLIPAAGAGEDPASLLAEAFAAAAAGRYEAADALYRRIVKEAPDSEQAAIASERLAPNALLRVRDLEMNGDPANRIDVFIMAEGYTREKKFQKLFDQGANDTVTYLAQAPVFRRYRKYFNFHAMNIASREDGVDGEEKQYDTALGAYESGAIQKQVAVDDQAVARYLRQDPRAEGYAIVLVRLGTFGTGGGGVAVAGGVPSNTVIHEWGHAFADLLDEYTSEVGYTGKTPRGYNVSDSPDPEQAPWKHWLDAGTEGVGMFPGGAGRSQGAWRGTASGCAMSSGPSFCLICREVIVSRIYDLVSPLDAAAPACENIVVEEGRPVAVQVVPTEVDGPPSLRVTFTLEAAQEPFAKGEQPAEGPAAEDGGFDASPPAGEDNPFAEDAGLQGDYGGYYFWNRPSRAAGQAPLEPLPGTEIKAERKRLKDKRSAYEVVLRKEDLGAGSFLLRARVVDPTDWVLKPEWLPLLSETRTWQVTVK
ncbi:MAG: hypothetical protein HY812_04965 [Planctomycetes bacterium]|nr:hypothetical protein [Planctomycetota bacterium]